MVQATSLGYSCSVRSKSLDSCTAQAAGGAGQGGLPPAQAAAGEGEGFGLGQAQQDIKAQLTSVGCRRGNVKNVTVGQIPTEL